ncbi:hypothetical protein KKA47_06990 [bacterium]|nr:hypothetical protein [bacterium]
MDEKKIKVKLSDGTLKEGVDIVIDESNERWSEIKLKDGAVLRIKFSVIQIIKVEGEFDEQGNPVYVVKGAPMITVVSLPDELRKKDT